MFSLGVWDFGSGLLLSANGVVVVNECVCVWWESYCAQPRLQRSNMEEMQVILHKIVRTTNASDDRDYFVW